MSILLQEWTMKEGCGGSRILKIIWTTKHVIAQTVIEVVVRLEMRGKSQGGEHVGEQHAQNQGWFCGLLMRPDLSNIQKEKMINVSTIFGTVTVAVMSV